MLLHAALVVFIMSPDPMEPTTQSFREAALEVLGPSAALHIEAAADTLPDTDAIERAGAADGVVELRWSPARDRVLLHCYVKDQARWIDRTILFSHSDPDSERGRLLGFSVASMFTEAPARREAVAEAAPHAPPEHALLPAAASTREPDPSSEPFDAASALPAAWSEVRGRSLEFSGIAASGFSGATAELGASAAIRFVLSEPLWLRVSVAGRAGEIPAAQANVRRAVAGLGISLSLLPDASRWEIGLRADLLGAWLEVAHLSSDDTQRVRFHRWFAGGDALATLGYRFSSLATVYASAGVEAMLGRTHVYTHGEEVAVVPYLRGVAEAGFRTNF